MPDIHAKFSPSASDRLIHCPPSLMLGEQYGPEDTGSEYSREGTEAHAVGEFLLKKALGLPCEDPRPTLKMYGPEILLYGNEPVGAVSYKLRYGNRRDEGENGVKPRLDQFLPSV